jgi:putative hydrolase of the HAD superfamily
VQVDAVFFDLGMVLVTFDWGIAIPRLAARGGGDAERVKDFLAHDYHELFERNAMSEDEFFERGRVLLDFAGTRGEFQTYWNEIFTEIPVGVQALKELAEKFPIYALSNTNPWHAVFLEETFDWMQLFRERFYSFELGARKPEPLIFERALARAGVTAERAVLIDDREENVQGARALGMHAIHAPTSLALHEGVADLLNHAATPAGRTGQQEKR